MVLLAVRMIADVTETRNVIPSLEFKTCMIIKSKVFTVLKLNCIKFSAVTLDYATATPQKVTFRG